MSLKIIREARVSARNVFPGPSGDPFVLNASIGDDSPLTIPEGSASGEAEEFVFQALTPVASAVTALDLNALTGAMAEQSGTANLNLIKGIEVRNLSKTDPIYIGGGSGGKAAPNPDAWSDADAGVTDSPFSADAHIVAVPPGGRFAWESPAGVAVPGASAKVLGIEQGPGAAGNIEVAIWGDKP